MKNLFLGLLLIMAGISCSYGQSRGINYKYNSVDDVLPPNWAGNESTTYEIANENVIVHTPMIRRGTNYYSVLSRFNNNLCYLGSKTILEDQSNPFYNGISKNDGGFATSSGHSPSIIRNYDNQGNLLFCKKLIDSNVYSSIGASNVSYPKMVANPDNNNIYFAYHNYSNETNDSIPNLYGSPLINIAEFSPSGSVVNAFQFKIPYDAVYSFNGGHVCHTWVFDNGITDIKYVKGPFGPASDRIWLSFNLMPRGTFAMDSNNQITSNQIQGPFLNSVYNVVVVATPYPGSSGGDATILLDHIGSRDPTFVQSKEAQGFSNAQMMLMTVENQVPHIYKFTDHYYSTPTNKYKFPFSINPGNFTDYGDLKNQQGTILFGIERYFGTFNPTTLQVMLRQQNASNFNTYGVVNYNKRNTNSLYINYNNGNGFPVTVSNFLIKEDISNIKLTCSSNHVSIQNAVSKPFTYFKLVGGSMPYSGITTINEPYAEIIDNGVITSQDVCLRCAAGKFSNEASIGSEDLKIELSPNPTKNYFELTTELTIEKVEVYSMLGQMVKTFDKQDQYTISDLSKGSYLVKVLTTEGTLNRALIIE